MEKKPKINVKEKIEQGWVMGRVIFEMAGFPKEHIVKTLKEYTNLMLQNPGIIVLKEENSEPQFHKEDKIWSTFTEMELLVDGLEKFVYICLSFTPASIEILQPKELTLTQKALSDWLNELLSLLHDVGMQNKSMNSEKQAYLRHVNALARNCISLALETPKTEKELMDKTGMDKITIEPFLDAMIKEKRIIKQDNKYSKP